MKEEKASELLPKLTKQLEELGYKTEFRFVSELPEHRLFVEPQIIVAEKLIRFNFLGGTHPRWDMVERTYVTSAMVVLQYEEKKRDPK